MTTTMQRSLTLLGLSLVLASCTERADWAQAGTPCEAPDFAVVDSFGGARRGACRVIADNHVEVRILPEDDGYINDSPWYSYMLQPNTPTTAIVTMHYEGGLHRYIPKISSDGIHWSPIDPQNVSVNDTETVATIELPIDDEAVWVSAQALLLPDAYDVWMRRMVAEHDVRLEQLGDSREGRPIYMLDSDPAGHDILFLVGRQHPPEVSGADAFLAFFEAVMADTPLANQFRQRFRVIAIPLMNPDGVAGGNWRHNLGGTDLNRDWGPFTQPETRLIRDLLDELDRDSASIRVFLDFHSTDRNLVYTQDAANETDPPGFTRTWLENVAARDTGYEFTNEERGTEKEGVAKNYMYHRYGIPSSTFEVADEADRELTRAAAAVFAEDLMRLMLEQEY